jgi:hypothetical protein
MATTNRTKLNSIARHLRTALDNLADCPSDKGSEKMINTLTDVESDLETALFDVKTLILKEMGHIA